MKAKIYIKGRITKGETLLEVISQYKSFEDVTEVEVNIDSNGGNKNEGDAIHDYLKNIDAEIPVTTKTGKAYSIAAKIFAAGSTRIVEDKDDALMIHFARAKVEGTAEELKEVAAELDIIEVDFIEFYSEHLGIDEDTVRNLLDNETFVSGKSAVDLGFATEVEKVAEIVAELNIEKSNINKMTEKKKQESKGRKLLEAMAEFVGIELDGKTKPEVNAELTLQDSNAADIVFPDLESDGTPVVGDKATIDGAAIPDGSYIMPSMEDQALVFMGGAITEIIPKEEEETEAEKETRLAAEAAEVVAEAKRKSEIKAETEGLEISTWSMKLVNDTFAVGDVLKCIGWEDEENIVSTAEVLIPDGRTVVTDSAGVIVKIKDAVIPAATTETEASFDELKGKMSTKIKAEIKAEHDAELLKKENEITSLKAKIGSKEFVAEEKVVPVVVKKGGSRAGEILSHLKN